MKVFALSVMIEGTVVVFSDIMRIVFSDVETLGDSAEIVLSSANKQCACNQ